MIRRAKASDLLELLRLGKESADEFDEDFSYLQAQNYITQSLNDPISFCPLVIDMNSMLQGYLLGGIVRSNFSDSVQGIECHWYVSPNHRKSRYGVLLLEAFEGWVKAKGVGSLIVSSGRDPRLEELLRRRGYNKMSSLMKKVF